MGGGVATVRRLQTVSQGRLTLVVVILLSGFVLFLPARQLYQQHQEMERLKDRMAAGEPSQARYRLDVELDDSIIGLGIRGDRAVTRERRTLRARYQLVEVGTGAVVLDATAGSDAGIDVVSSEYATVAAEQTAADRLSDVVADQIVSRLGLFASRTPPAQ